jgi:hypothetical protein
MVVDLEVGKRRHVGPALTASSTVNLERVAILREGSCPCPEAFRVAFFRQSFQGENNRNVEAGLDQRLEKRWNH